MKLLLHRKEHALLPCRYAFYVYTKTQNLALRLALHPPNLVYLFEQDQNWVNQDIRAYLDDWIVYFLYQKGFEEQMSKFFHRCREQR